MASPVDVGAPAKSSLLDAFTQPLGRRFAAKYAAIAAGLFAVYCFPYQYVGISERPFAAYLGAYARLVGGVLSLFGEGVTVVGTRIDGRHPLEIVRNCDAIEVMILLSSAILAVQAPPKRRLAALAMGLCATVLVNVIRIVGLYYVGVLAPARFEVMHQEVFPLVLVVFAALAFVLLLGWMSRSTPAVSATSESKG